MFMYRFDVSGYVCGCGYNLSGPPKDMMIDDVVTDSAGGLGGIGTLSAHTGTNELPEMSSEAATLPRLTRDIRAESLEPLKPALLKRLVSPADIPCTTAPVSAESNDIRREVVGLQMSELAVVFKGFLEGESRFADDVRLDQFYEACCQLQPLLEELGQWAELRDRLAMLEVSATAGLTIGECLDLEAKVHKLEGFGSAAKFADPSSASGLMWSARILAFVAELLGQSGRCGAGGGEKGCGLLQHRFSVAAPAAFERHIGTCFGTSASESSAESAARELFTAGLPSERGEEALLQKLGGPGGVVQLARQDMVTFADVLMPLADRIRASFKRRRMDNSERRLPRLTRKA